MVASTETRAPKYPLLVEASKGQGVAVYGTMIRTSTMTLVLQFDNKSSTPLDVINIQFNKNTFGLVPQVNNKFESPVPPGGRGELKIPVAYNKAFSNPGAPPSLEINAALQNASNNSVSYFNLVVGYHVMYAAGGKMDDKEFIKLWTTDLKEKQVTSTVTGLVHLGPDAVKARLESNGFNFIAQRHLGSDQQVIFFNSKTDQNQLILCEVTLKDGINAAKLVIRTDNATVAGFAKASLEALLSS